MRRSLPTHSGSVAIAILILAAAQHATSQIDGLEKRRAFLEPAYRAHKFQTAEEIFPKRVVRAGSGVWKLEKAPVQDFAPSYRWKGKESTIDDFIRRSFTSALLILKDGQIIKESYFAGSSPATRFFSFSSGKSITSTLVGMAIEDGHIESVDDRLTRYLPALIGSAYQDVSIKDALQMVSGVHFEDESYDWSDDSIPFTKARNQSIIAQRYRFVEAANALKKQRPAGEKFEYNTMNSALLGWAVENATGKRLARYMEERLWRPAGMESDAAWLLDGPPEIGREMAGGDFVATLRDYGRFGLLFANNGKANGKQLISSEWVESATRPDRAPVQYGNLGLDGSKLGYGYHWWLLPDGQFMAQGVYGQMIYVAPSRRVVMVKMSHWPVAWDLDLVLESYAFFDAVVEALEL